jgi:hypothetical protein
MSETTNFFYKYALDFKVFLLALSYLSLFHQSNTSRPLRNVQKYSRISFRDVGSNSRKNKLIPHYAIYIHIAEYGIWLHVMQYSGESLYPLPMFLSKLSWLEQTQIGDIPTETLLDCKAKSFSKILYVALRRIKIGLYITESTKKKLSTLEQKAINQQS